MKYLLGIDLGTSGTKTVLFDQNGKGICSATVEYPMYQPQNGWAEQDPKDWYNAAVSTYWTRAAWTRKMSFPWASAARCTAL